MWINYKKKKSISILILTVPCEWQGEMDRWMRIELWTFHGGVVGARIWETTGHLVNGAGPSTANHAQDLIHHHPSSVTHHHCVQDSRERKNVWMWTADDALRSCGGRLTRRTELKGCLSSDSRDFPRDTKSSPAEPSISRINVIIIIIGSTKLHVQKGFLRYTER